MAQKMNRLSAKAVTAAKGPALLADGGGLYLRVSTSAAKSWVFIYRKGVKRTEIGLGSLTAVSLAEARSKAGECRTLVNDGKSPKAARAANKRIPTFGEMADQFIASMAPSWRNEKHLYQWTATLRDYAAPLRSLPVNEITVEHVVAVLKPHWEKRPETAGRLRGRIERVLNAAKAAGHRAGENPAAWRGHLENLLPARPRLSRGHHPAMPFAQVSGFIADLRQREGVAALALEFLILTAGRSGEVRGARWAEIDQTSKVWIIPALRMKAGHEHRVPLVPRANAILETMAKLGTEGLVFPGLKRGEPLSDMTLLAVLKRMKLGHLTVHGFRSSFKDWCTETTGFPNELSEAALAHITGSAVERAYRRGDQLDRRRELMAAWAKFCEPTVAENVVSFGVRRMVNDAN